MKGTSQNSHASYIAEYWRQNDVGIHYDHSKKKQTKINNFAVETVMRYINILIIG